MSARMASLVERRRVLRSALGLATFVVMRPALGEPATVSAADLKTALREFAGGAAIGNGRVRLGIALLVENGNAAPITVDVESPMTAADHVRRIAVFNEKNPQRDVAVFTLGPRAGKASVSTRIRLATSQRLVAVAQMSDGTYWQDSADVIVTIAACIET